MFIALVNLVLNIAAVSLVFFAVAGFASHKLSYNQWKVLMILSAIGVFFVGYFDKV